MAAYASLAPDGRRAARVVTTMVQFKRLTESEIAAYLESGEWEGKAGGYAIQGMAAASCRRSTAPIRNVVGLPLVETMALLGGPRLEARRDHPHRARGDRVRGTGGHPGRRSAGRDPRRDRDDPAVTEALFAARVDRRRSQAQRGLSRLRPAAAGAAGRQGRARRGRHRRAPADPRSSCARASG